MLQPWPPLSSFLAAPADSWWEHTDCLCLLVVIQRLHVASQDHIFPLERQEWMGCSSSQTLETDTPWDSFPTVLPNHPSADPGGLRVLWSQALLWAQNISCSTPWPGMGPPEDGWGEEHGGNEEGQRRSRLSQTPLRDHQPRRWRINRDQRSMAPERRWENSQGTHIIRST